MLTLSRRTEEAILIGTDIRIVIKRIDGEIVKIGIDAPKNMPIYREEVFSKVSQQNKEALVQTQAATGGELRLKFPRPAKAPASAPAPAPADIPVE